MMPQSARILTTARPKPAVPLEDCQREYGRAIRSASPRSSRYTGPSSLPPSCTVQRPRFSIGSRSGYWSGLTNAACAPSLALNGKTMCRTKKSSREPAWPAQSPSCFRCSCAIVVLQESVTRISWRDSSHRRESAISHGSRRLQTETAGAHQ